MRIIGFLFLMAVLLIGGVYLSRNALLERVITQGGSYALQAKVTLEGVSLDPVSGMGHIRGLKVGNPAGFAPGTALSLDDIQFHLDLSTVTKDEVVIHKIQMDGLDIRLSGNTEATNLGKLKDNLYRLNRSSVLNPAVASASDKGEFLSRTVLIEELSIQGGQVSVNFTGGPDQGLSVDIRPLFLTDIGGKNQTLLDVGANLFVMLEARALEAGVGGLGQRLNAIKEKTMRKIDTFIRENRSSP